MRLFLKCSFLLLLLSGCRTYFPYYLTKVPVAEKTSLVIENPYFKIGGEYLFRFAMEAYGHNFNGILAVKKISPSEDRVALTTEFGNTLLDFSLIEKKLKVNYVVKEWNRRPVLRLLGDTFTDLLQTSYHCTGKYHAMDGTALWFSKEKKKKTVLEGTVVEGNPLVYSVLVTHKRSHYNKFYYPSPFDEKGKINLERIEYRGSKDATATITMELTPIE